MKYSVYLVILITGLGGTTNPALAMRRVSTQARTMTRFLGAYLRTSLRRKPNFVTKNHNKTLRQPNKSLYSNSTRSTQPLRTFKDYLKGNTETFTQPLQQTARTKSIKPLVSPQFGQQQRTIYSTNYFKGIYKVLPEKYKKFSPLFGAAWFESGIIKKMYQFGNQEHATIKLIKHLFNVTIHSDILRSTQVPSRPGSWLTPNSIGRILGALERGTLKGNQELILLMQEERRQLIQRQQIEGVSSEIKPGKIRNFFNLIIRALEEESQQLYVPNTTRTILLALLHFKAETKQDMLDFFNGLNVYLDDLDINQETQENFLNNNYTATDSATYHVSMNDLRQQIQQFMLRAHPELVISQTIKALQNEQELPPPIPQGRCGYNGQPAVPTCVESALRDFCNILLFNPETGLFDFDMLPEGITPRDEFKEFYTNNPDPLKEETTQAWMNLISGHNELGINYIQGDYEVRSRLDNIFKLVNYFFNIDAKNCGELSELLSNDQRSITFMPARDIEQHVNDNNIQVTINGTINFTIKVKPGHGWLERSTQQQERDYYQDFDAHHYGAQNANCIMETLLSFVGIDQPAMDENTYQYLADAMLPFTAKIDLSNYPITQLPPSLLHLLAFSSDISDPNVRLRFACAYLEAYKEYTFDKDVLVDLSTLLIQDLPDDHYFYQSLGSVILTGNIHMRPEFSHICSKLDANSLMYIAKQTDLEPDAVDFVYTALGKTIESIKNLEDFEERIREGMSFTRTQIGHLLIKHYNERGQNSTYHAATLKAIEYGLQSAKKTGNINMPFLYNEFGASIIFHNLVDKHPFFMGIVNRADQNTMLRVARELNNQVVIDKITKEQELRAAYQDGNRKRVLELIDQGAFPNEGDRFFEGCWEEDSLLVQILKNDDIEVLERFVQRPICLREDSDKSFEETMREQKGLHFLIRVDNPHENENVYKTPLCYARSKKAIQLLLQGGALWNTSEKGQWVVGPGGAAGYYVNPEEINGQNKVFVLNPSSCYFKNPNPDLAEFLITSRLVSPEFMFRTQATNAPEIALFIVNSGYLSHEKALDIISRDLTLCDDGLRNFIGNILQDAKEKGVRIHHETRKKLEQAGLIKNDHNTASNHDHEKCSQCNGWGIVSVGIHP